MVSLQNDLRISTAEIMKVIIIIKQFLSRETTISSPNLRKGSMAVNPASPTLKGGSLLKLRQHLL